MTYRGIDTAAKISAAAAKELKAAGISLFRILRPLAFAVALLSVGAFFFSNNVLPKSQMKLWALIFSLRQKSPELQIPIGEF